MKYEFITDPAAEGQRIDACIRRFLPEVPQRTVQQSFTRRDVKLDGKRVKTINAVNAARKAAIADGMSMEEAMATINDETVSV